MLAGAVELARDALGTGGPLVPQGALGLLLVGAAILVSALRGSRAHRAARVLILTAGALCLFGLTAYAYGGSRGDEHSVLWPMRPGLALALLVACAATVVASRHHGHAGLLRGDGLGARLARRVLLGVVATMVLVGALRIEAEEAGLFDERIGAALMVVVAVAAVTAVVALSARWLDATQAKELAQQAQLEAVIDHTTSLVVLKDARTGRFMLANRRFEELSGRPRGGLAGLTDEDVLPADVAATEREHDRQALEAGTALEFEETLELGGEERTYHSVRFPLCEQQGREPYAICAIKTDITDRKRSEQAVTEARRRAEHADRAKSEFLSRMSHELRTPLNSIIGFGQLLEMDGLDAVQREYVDRMLRAGRHLLDLINEVLDISRIEAGALGISLEPVDVDAAVHDALDLVRPMAAERGLRVSGPAVPAAPRYAAADQQRLKQILLNLLSNAVKYNREEGAIAVSVEQDGRRVRILVADTGPGLTPEQARRAFTPFERLGAEASDIPGTGLGLALSKRLAEAMQGTLTLESACGAGTTFVLELDCEESPRVTTAPVPEPAIALPAATPAPARVLYVEDNLSNLRLVEELFARRPNVDLMVAMQGTLALELATQHQPSLILLDLHLPDVPGTVVLARLRSHPATARVPVIVLSADATKGRAERLLEAGANAFLTKPLDLRRFLAVVDEYLAESNAAAATDART